MNSYKNKAILFVFSAIIFSFFSVAYATSSTLKIHFINLTTGDNAEDIRLQKDDAKDMKLTTTTCENGGGTWIDISPGESCDMTFNADNTHNPDTHVGFNIQNYTNHDKHGHFKVSIEQDSKNCQTDSGERQKTIYFWNVHDQDHTKAKPKDNKSSSSCNSENAHDFTTTITYCKGSCN